MDAVDFTTPADSHMTSPFPSNTYDGIVYE